MEFLSEWWGLLVAMAGIFGSVIAAGGYFASRYEKVGPNEVLIVSGRKGVYMDPFGKKKVEKNFRIYHGGGTFVLPVREKVSKMSVELMTLEIRTPEFFTKFGVPIVVDGIAQIKVRSDDPISTITAAEMFLSKKPDEMNEIAHQMMQGHLRAVISTLPFEEIHANPEAFAQTVQRLTAEDLANMGIQVVSFTIREIKDPSGYLKAIGRPKVAELHKNAILGEAASHRDAEVGKSAAEREASVASSKARQEAELAAINKELAVQNAQMEKEKRLNAMKVEVARTQAASDMSYECAKVKHRQSLVEEELGVSKVEREKQIEIEELEVRRKEIELMHGVKKPAEAERYRVETITQAERLRLVSMAEAQAEAERQKGLAEADVIRAKGEAEAQAIRLKALAKAEGEKAMFLAEAEGMQQKAKAYQEYNSAAVSQMLIEKMPEIAAAVAAPLQRIDRIVMISGANGDNGDSSGFGRITKGVTEVMAQVPAVFEAMTGVGLEDLIRKVPAFKEVAEVKKADTASGQDQKALTSQDNGTSQGLERSQSQ